MATEITLGNWQLIHVSDGHTATVGEEVKTFRGEVAFVLGGQPPKHEASSGRVEVNVEPMSPGISTEFFPSIVGLKWIKKVEAKEVPNGQA